MFGKVVAETITNNFVEDAESLSLLGIEVKSVVCE